MTILLPTFPGQNEDELTTSSEVQKQTDYIKEHTLIPMGSEPEVKDTETAANKPKLYQASPGQEKTHEEAIEWTKRFWDRQTIDRQPNAWDCNGSLVINPKDGPQTIWQPRIGMSQILIYNYSSSAGTIYIANAASKLLGSVNRGWPVAAGATWSIQTEAGGFAIAPSGATIAIAWTWFETIEGEPFI